MNNETRPMVSVIMAVYNQAQFVSEAIDSVLGQTFNDWELIVCDDASTDGTYDILEKYRMSMPGKIFLLRNETNYGVSRARNRAIKESRAEYIAFLDSDDSWEPGKLEAQTGLLFKTSRNGLVFTGANVVCDNSFSETDKMLQETHFNRLCASGKLDKKELVLGNNICFSSIMVPRKTIEAAGYFDECLSHQVEDWLANIKIAYLFDIACVPERLTNYRLHKDSYSAKFFLKEKIDRRSYSHIRRIMADYMIKNLFAKQAESGILERIRLLGYFYFIALTETFVSIMAGNSRLAAAARFLKKLARFPRRFVGRMKFKNAANLLILFVTAKCNSRCKTCFYWKETGSEKNEMSLEHIRSIFSTIPKTLCALITGGEPFLRHDISDVIKSASASGNVRSISINTNGTMPGKTADIMADILQNDKSGKAYHVNVSIDGFRETHNRIRGIDCYDTAMATISALTLLKKKFRNFCISAITVISKDNIDEAQTLARFMVDNTALDFHYFEIIRGEPRSSESLELNKMRVKSLYENILPIQSLYFRRQGLRGIKKEVERLAHMYRLQLDNFFESKDWDVRCLAGEKVYVIYEDGKFSLCEQRRPVLDMRDYSYNVGRALRSEAIREEIRKAACEKCFCTHGCFISNSLG